jgi:hypothetical protein
MSKTTTEQVVALLRERFGPCADACVDCEAIALDAVIAAVQHYQLHSDPPYRCCVGSRKLGHAADCLGESREWWPTDAYRGERDGKRPRVPLLARLGG